MSRKSAILNIMMDAGADVNITDEHGLNALMWACKYSPAEDQSEKAFARILSQTEDINKTGKIWASAKPNGRGGYGDYQYRTAFQFLAENYITQYGRTEGEVERNILPKIRMMLDAGADISDPDDWVSLDYSEEYTQQPKIQARIEKLKTFIEAYQEQQYQLNDDRAEVYYDYEL